MKQTGNKALTPRQQKALGDQLLLESVRRLATDAVDKIEQLEATRVTYDDLAAEVHKLKAQIEKRATHEDLIVISGSIDKSLAARVIYDAPVLAVRRRASRWSWLFGGSRHTEVVVELRKVTIQ